MNAVHVSSYLLTRSDEMSFPDFNRRTLLSTAKMPMNDPVYALTVRLIDADGTTSGLLKVTVT